MNVRFTIIHVLHPSSLYTRAHFTPVILYIRTHFIFAHVHLRHWFDTRVFSLIHILHMKTFYSYSHALYYVYTRDTSLVWHSHSYAFTGTHFTRANVSRRYPFFPPARCFRLHVQVYLYSYAHTRTHLTQSYTQRRQWSGTPYLAFVFIRYNRLFGLALA